MNEQIETLHKICEALMEELEDYEKRIEKSEGMSAGDLDAVDKLSHALKSIKTTIAMIEADGDYSNRGYSRNYGSSYARGRMNARRDSMGRYSRTGYSYDDGMEELLVEMREMLPSLPEEKRRTAERLMNELNR